MSLLFLAACGGGGGGAGNTPIKTPSDINNPGSITHYTIADVETRESNVNVSAMVDNGTKREEHIAKMYVAAGLSVPISNNGALNVDLTRGGSTKNHKNGVSQGAVDLFENMHEWFGDEKMAEFLAMFPNDMTDEEIAEVLLNTSNINGLMNSLRHALILAGYGLEIKDQGNHYVIHLVQQHKDEIQQQADEIYNQMGQFQEFDITRAALNINDDTISFLLDGNKINGVLYKENAGQTNREVEYTLTKSANVDNTYNMVLQKYVYGIGFVDKLNEHDYDPEGSHEIEIESTETLDLNTVKTRLLAEIEYLHTHRDYFSAFHNVQTEDTAQATSECSTCSEQEIRDMAQAIAANRLYNAAIARVNALTQNDLSAAVLHQNNGAHLFFDADEPANVTMNLETYGKDVGLAFADFGKMNTYSDAENEARPNDYRIVYGGYSDKLISPEDFTDTETKTFKGTMLGKATVSYWENHSEDDELVSELPQLALRDDNAQLVFSHDANTHTNTETLTASFNNWYDMTMTKTGDTANLAFTNYTYKDGNNNIDNSYRFLGDQPDNSDHYNDNYIVNNFTETRRPDFLGNNDGITGETRGNVGIQYYGVNNVPSEAVGLVKYQENEPMGNVEDYIKDVNFEVGFGMTKDYINQ